MSTCHQSPDSNDVLAHRLLLYFLPDRKDNLLVFVQKVRIVLIRF